jgi:hypothetical protein
MLPAPARIDWDAQPDAFRHWQGAQVTPLPRAVMVADIAWSQLDLTRPPQEFTPASLGSLLRLCAGITAWKQYGGNRWSLRAHPSSGNLHPTETWLMCAGVPGLEKGQDGGLFHYQPRDHSRKNLPIRAATSAAIRLVSTVFVTACCRTRAITSWTASAATS